jgi:hypothetical protein
MANNASLLIMLKFASDDLKDGVTLRSLYEVNEDIKWADVRKKLKTVENIRAAESRAAESRAAESRAAESRAAKQQLVADDSVDVADFDFPKTLIISAVPFFDNPSLLSLDVSLLIQRWLRRNRGLLPHPEFVSKVTHTLLCSLHRMTANMFSSYFSQLCHWLKPPTHFLVY